MHDIQGWTGMMIAAAQGHAEIVNLLLGHSALRDSINEQSEQVLCYDSKRKNIALFLHLFGTNRACVPNSSLYCCFVN